MDHMDNQQQQHDKQPAKMGGISGTNANANGKSITNIYYDCLERIFELLDLQSLLNVANTCKRLQVAAAAYYGDVYGNHSVILWTRRGHRWPEPGIYDYHNGTIVVHSLKFCLPFLRCFGSKISHLDVRYDESASDNNYLDRYINQYCAKTLKNIELNDSSVFVIENSPNPFECIERVQLFKLKDQLPHFVNLFPKLRELDLIRISVDANCTDVHFPNIEKLSIQSGHPGRSTMKSLLGLLHANPQLKNLSTGMSIGQDMTVNELLNTISQNPSITKLKLCNYFDSKIDPADLVRFASERPQTVELNLPHHVITPQDAIKFIRQLKSLKVFRFRINDQADYDLLVSQLDSEWQHEIDSMGLITLKR